MNTSINGGKHVQSNKASNAVSNIPLRKPPLNRSNSCSTTSFPASPSTSTPSVGAEVQKWRGKYDDVERKRKSTLIEREKLSRQYNDVQRKLLDVQVKNEQLETELFEKNEKYTKLTEASKSLFKEYEMLKNKYETETVAMARALKDASVWYKQNKELKRKTMILDTDTVDEGVDAGEPAGDSDIENLNKTIKQLSAEVAELQTEVDSLKHIEFTTTEQNIKVMEELEGERNKNVKLTQENRELKKEYEQIMRVSDIMKKELENLKQMEENQRNNAVTLRREADDYKKERNILAHQSTLLLQGLNNEDVDEFRLLLEEVQRLKRSSEEEKNRYEEEISNLQEKLECLEQNLQVELLEERLKLVESELQDAIERSEAAEKKLKAVPAPPPPPPLPFDTDQPPVVPLRVKRRSRANIAELAEAIGMKEEQDVKKVVRANDDIINVIKEGKFTLKKVKNNFKQERESTKAVSELLNILGSLRKAPKSRQSQVLDTVS